MGLKSSKQIQREYRQKQQQRLDEARRLIAVHEFQQDRVGFMTRTLVMARPNAEGLFHTLSHIMTNDMEPFHIMFKGEGGQGKSFAASWLCNLASSMGLGVYRKMNLDVYDDAAINLNNIHIVYRDEFMNSDDAEYYDWLLRIVNMVAWRPLCSDPKNKQKDRAYKPGLIITTTNFGHPPEDVDRKAFERRCFVVDVDRGLYDPPLDKVLDHCHQVLKDRRAAIDKSHVLLYGKDQLNPKAAEFCPKK